MLTCGAGFRRSTVHWSFSLIRPFGVRNSGMAYSVCWHHVGMRTLTCRNRKRDSVTSVVRDSVCRLRWLGRSLSCKCLNVALAGTAQATVSCASLFLFWGWTRSNPLTFTGLRCAMSQKIQVFITTALRTSLPTYRLITRFCKLVVGQPFCYFPLPVRRVPEKCRISSQFHPPIWWKSVLF
jgi:hypothetical protein